MEIPTFKVKGNFDCRIITRFLNRLSETFGFVYKFSRIHHAIGKISGF